MAQEKVCLYFLPVNLCGLVHITKQVERASLQGRPHHIFYDKLESLLVFCWVFFSCQRLYAITLDIKKSNKP